MSSFELGPRRLEPLALVAAACLAWLCNASPACAQVNVEPLRAHLKAHGFGARVGFSATGFAGNTQGVVLGTSDFIGFHATRSLAYLAASGNFEKLGGVVSIANWFGHVRHDYELSSRLSWEEFGQLESDRFRRITWRELVGTGPRLQLLELEQPAPPGAAESQSSAGPWLDLFVATAYMYEYTALSGSAQRESGGAHRSSSYVTLSLRPHAKVLVTWVTYVQPRFDKPRDLRLLSALDADFEVTQRLHSGMSVKYRFDSLPPPGVHASDLELKSSLEVQF